MSNLFDDIELESLKQFYAPNYFSKKNVVGGLFEELKKENEPLAQAYQERNTEALTNLFDMMQFYGEDFAHHPVSKEGLEDLPYRNVMIPLGAENRETIPSPHGKAAGVYRNPNYPFPEAMAFPGSVGINTVIHEGRHPVLEGMNRQAEEIQNRKLDYYDAVKNKDHDRMRETLLWLENETGDRGIWNEMLRMR